MTLKRGSGVGYYIKGYVYIKHRDGFNSWVLRCRVNGCGGKAVIVRKTGKAMVKQPEHSHPAPKYDSLEFVKGAAPGKSPSSLEKRRLPSKQALLMTPPGSTGGSVSTSGECQWTRLKREKNPPFGLDWLSNFYIINIGIVLFAFILFCLFVCLFANFSAS